MKDLSLFLVKNSFGVKMKKGLKNMCNGESSTSILDPQQTQRQRQPTLEEMIVQLEMEEKMGRKVDGMIPHRMSCVSSCDILRSARNALNQYPRFSLDGKDAMYRSSFRNYELEVERRGGRRLPSVVGGESVIWCKPGVVGRLMGLDAMPIPLNTNYRRDRLSAIINQHTHTRRRRVVGSCSRPGYCVVNPPNTRFL